MRWKDSETNLRRGTSAPWRQRSSLQQSRAGGGYSKYPKMQQCWYCRNTTWHTGMQCCIITPCKRSNADHRKTQTNPHVDPAIHSGPKPWLKIATQAIGNQMTGRLKILAKELEEDVGEDDMEVATTPNDKATKIV